MAADVVSSDLRGGRPPPPGQVLDDDPSTRMTTGAVFTELFPPHPFATRRRIAEAYLAEHAVEEAAR